jgi:hypothetical protein
MSDARKNPHGRLCAQSVKGMLNQRGAICVRAGTTYRSPLLFPLGRFRAGFFCVPVVVVSVHRAGMSEQRRTLKADAVFDPEERELHFRAAPEGGG